MKKIAAFLTLVFAAAMFAATPQEIEKARVQYRTDFAARFTHAVKISGMKKLTPEQTGKLNRAADKYSATVIRIFKENGQLDAMLKIVNDPMVRKMQLQVLKSTDRPGYIKATKAFSSYVYKKYPRIEDPKLVSSVKNAAMVFRKDIETMRLTDVLWNEKEEFSFWRAVLLPAAH